VEEEAHQLRATRNMTTYDGDDSEDIMQISAALENLQLDRKTHNLTNSWSLVFRSMHGGDGSSEEDGRFPRYLGVMVGEYSSRIKAWDDVILKLRSRLSKWKVKTLSIGGRLTLLKSVLGASPIYNMSIFKVPTGVLKVMESIRSRFFNGADQSEKKVTWVAWNKVLASKKHGGLGVSSFFALNRALLLKWVWRFVSQDGSLWYKVIRALYGSSVETHSTSLSSNWCSIMREVNKLKGKGFDFWSHCKKRIGNGDDSRFWFDCWIGDVPLRVKFPRLFALDLNKEASVAVKLSAPIDISFRRNARGGIEEHLLADLTSLMDSVTLSNSGDRWVCDLVSDGNFRVKEIRNYIDDLFLPHQAAQTRWIKYIPIKVNIFAWRARQDCLPTRVNLIRRGITIESSLCPVCSVCEEDVCHIFFRCDLAQLVLRRICRWWGLDPHDWSSFQEWQSWILSIQFSSKVKAMLEGVSLGHEIRDTLEDKKITVADKMNHNVLGFSLRRAPRDGVEMEQFKIWKRILEVWSCLQCHDNGYWSQIPDIHSINESQEEGEINDKKEQMGYEMNAPGKSVDSFEEGEIIGESDDGCVKDCMGKKLDDDVEKDIEDCSNNVTEKCGVVNNNMSNNVEGEILEDHFDGDRGNDTIEDNADVNPSTNVSLEVNIPEVANDSSIVSPSTPPGNDLNIAKESCSTWLDYVLFAALAILAIT
ncbi:RNA-directed DNA polymerase, eukaryota, partial [Tanacetum coccineum]